MPRRTYHGRTTRPDPALEPEFFWVDEIPATNFSSPLSSLEVPASASTCSCPTPSINDTEAEPTIAVNTRTEIDPTSTVDTGAGQPDAVAAGLEPELTAADDLEPLFARLARSEFRSRFRLRAAERAYIERKGLPTLRRHAEEFVRTRLAPAEPANDGRQTPMRGHPVFIAQHATGCCCRGCLSKWHGIPAGRPLTEDEQHYVVRVLLAWISRQLAR